MNRYTVLLTKSAEKSLYKIQGNTSVKIADVLTGFVINPRPTGCKKLKGFKNLWRVRVGDYRIIYAIDDVILLIDVREIGHRKSIYTGL